VCLVVVLLGGWLLPNVTTAAPLELLAVHADALGCDDCPCSAEPILAHDHCPSGQTHACCVLPANEAPCVPPLGASKARGGEPERIASRRLTPPLRPLILLAA
jgi:hypothetical protein